VKIAIHGLGKMGIQIARKLAESDHQVLAHNRSPQKIEEAVKYGAQAAPSKQDVVDGFSGSQAIIWIMLPAETVENELHAWLDVLPSGSILIDGGNSDFRQSQTHANTVATRGSQMLDIGVSGGLWGYQNGFSMMVGGDGNSYHVIEPVLRSLATPGGAYQHFGASGSGHFVKMVHNAIEYGMMESLAEGYQLLKAGPYAGLDLAEAANVWQHHSVITSWLNELCQKSLTQNPELDGIEGYVAESGEARWALTTAQELNLSMPAIKAAFDVRLASQKGEVSFATKLIAAMRNQFGGHPLNKKP